MILLAIKTAIFLSNTNERFFFFDMMPKKVSSFNAYVRLFECGMYMYMNIREVLLLMRYTLLKGSPHVLRLYFFFCLLITNIKSLDHYRLDIIALNFCCRKSCVIHLIKSFIFLIFHPSFSLISDFFLLLFRHTYKK